MSRWCSPFVAGSHDEVGAPSAHRLKSGAQPTPLCVDGVQLTVTAHQVDDPTGALWRVVATPGSLTTGRVQSVVPLVALWAATLRS